MKFSVTRASTPQAEPEEVELHDLTALLDYVIGIGWPVIVEIPRLTPAGVTRELTVYDDHME